MRCCLNDNLSIDYSYATAQQPHPFSLTSLPLLDIDLDGIFERLLLLQKKKYAANKIEKATTFSIEVKSLDMKHREYCIL